MMRCILIDDEKHCRESLETLIRRYCPELEIVAVCDGPVKGIKAIETHSPNLLFLDIAMPQMDGFQMLEQLENHDFQVIFTTAFNEYAIEAFKVHAIDYLMKPIDRKELMDAVGRALEWADLKRAKKAGEQIGDLLKYYNQRQTGGHISIPTAEGLVMIDAGSICYCLGDGNYSVIHLLDGSRRLISKHLKFLEEKLEAHPGFFRLHHSAIINLGQVAEYVRGKGGYVVMKDGKTITVSRQRKQQLIEALG